MIFFRERKDFPIESHNDFGFFMQLVLMFFQSSSRFLFFFFLTFLNFTACFDELRGLTGDLTVNQWQC